MDERQQNLAYPLSLVHVVPESLTDSLNFTIENTPCRSISYKIAYAPSEDSDQTAHLQPVHYLWLKSILAFSS